MVAVLWRIVRRRRNKKRCFYFVGRGEGHEPKTSTNAARYEEGSGRTRVFAAGASDCLYLSSVKFWRHMWVSADFWLIRFVFVFGVYETGCFELQRIYFWATFICGWRNCVSLSIVKFERHMLVVAVLEFITVVFFVGIFLKLHPSNSIVSTWSPFNYGWIDCLSLSFVWFERHMSIVAVLKSIQFVYVFGLSITLLVTISIVSTSESYLIVSE